MNQHIIDKLNETKDGVRTVKQYACAYSHWHRTLGKEYYQTDIDHVEYRTGKGIVAIIDTTSNFNDERHIINSKKYVWNRNQLQRKILLETANALNVPVYYVFHTNDFSVFHVHDLRKELDQYTAMTKDEYTFFICNL
jgi:hypothetical protein